MKWFRSLLGLDNCPPHHGVYSKDVIIDEFKARLIRRTVESHCGQDEELGSKFCSNVKLAVGGRIFSVAMS